MERTCPDCGLAYPEDHTFCEHCGAPLVAPSQWRRRLPYAIILVAVAAGGVFGLGYMQDNLAANLRASVLLEESKVYPNSLEADVALNVENHSMLSPTLISVECRPFSCSLAGGPQLFEKGRTEKVVLHFARAARQSFTEAPVLGATFKAWGIRTTVPVQMPPLAAPPTPPAVTGNEPAENLPPDPLRPVRPKGRKPGRTAKSSSGPAPAPEPPKSSNGIKITETTDAK